MIHRWKKYQELLETRRRELCEQLAARRAQMAIERGGDLADQMRNFSERELAVRTSTAFRPCSRRWTRPWSGFARAPSASVGLAAAPSPPGG